MPDPLTWHTHGPPWQLVWLLRATLDKINTVGVQRLNLVKGSAACQHTQTHLLIGGAKVQQGPSQRHHAGSQGEAVLDIIASHVGATLRQKGESAVRQTPLRSFEMISCSSYGRHTR